MTVEARSERSPDAVRSRFTRLVVWLVAGAYFMEMLDGTVISTALPQMARTFRVDPVALNVGVSAYLLTLGVFIPISGWMAERFGARSVFASAIALFTAASVLCGASLSLPEFTAARVLQGVGGAMMTPVGRLVVLRTTEKKDLLNTIALIIWPGLLAPVMGPAVGGFITTYFSWRWIFLLNLPLGLTGLGLTLALVPNLRDGSRRRLDGVGFVLSGVCVTAVVFGLDALGEHPLSAGAWLALALGAATGLAAARHFERHPWPLLDFRAMKRRTFSVYVWGGSVFRAVIATPPFLMPLMFQLAFGMDAFRAGLLTMAIFAGNIAIKPLTSAILRAFGFRTVLLVNGAFVAASLAVCGLFQPDTSPLLIAAALFAGGASRSLQFTALSTLQFAEIPSEEMNGANTLSSAVAQITSGLGVAIAALALDICAGVSGSHESPPTLVDFHAACFLIAAFSLIALLDWICLPRDAGDIIARRGEHGRG